MQETSKYTVFNIREYLGDGSHGLGEDTLLQVLSEFSCKINPDVERFIKKQSIEFAKKQQSVTYLVFSTEDAELVGYFALTIKPITVNAEPFSNTIKRKLSRVSTLNEQRIVRACDTADTAVTVFSGRHGYLFGGSGRGKSFVFLPCEWFSAVRYKADRFFQRGAA